LYQWVFFTFYIFHPIESFCYVGSFHLHYYYYYYYYYRPISTLNNFPKIVESVVHDHLSFNFKFKLHPSQHGFIKSKSTVTNLVTYLNDVVPSVCSHGQFDCVYFDLSQAFDKVPHTLLLNKLNKFGLSSLYVDSKVTFHLDLPLFRS
jgi:hypothetical protein